AGSSLLFQAALRVATVGLKLALALFAAVLGATRQDDASGARSAEALFLQVDLHVLGRYGSPLVAYENVAFEHGDLIFRVVHHAGRGEPAGLFLQAHVARRGQVSRFSVVLYVIGPNLSRSGALRVLYVYVSFEYVPLIVDLQEGSVRRNDPAITLHAHVAFQFSPAVVRIVGQLLRVNDGAFERDAHKLRLGTLGDEDAVRHGEAGGIIDAAFLG